MGMAVTLADPSGLWRTLKEGMASASALMAGKKGVAGVTLMEEDAHGNNQEGYLDSSPCGWRLVSAS